MTHLAIGVLLAALLPPARGGVLIAYESDLEAYTQAFDGVKAGLNSSQYRAIDIGDKTAASGLRDALGARDINVVVAIGGRALDEVRTRKTAVPVVASMVLGRAEGATSRVDLEVPLAVQLGAMRELYPRRLRVGMIRNPEHAGRPADELAQIARNEGYTAGVGESAGPAQLLKAVATLKGKVDFLLAIPDPALYNAATIKPLLLAAIEDRLPIIGFSPALVRAGAAAGIYPDYRGIGLQAAQLAARLARGEAAPDMEAPARVQITVNSRVARLLGVEFRTDAPLVEVLR